MMVAIVKEGGLMNSDISFVFLQQYWWFLVSVIGSLLVFLFFIQGGQTLIFNFKDDLSKKLVINSLGRKWELGYTTLVMFGGAMFAAFPLFYATSFGGAYFFWMLILISFVIQAVSYEFRKKSGNFLGAKTFEIFLLLNGVLGVTLLGVAVASFFSGSPFYLDESRGVHWQSTLIGLEAMLNPFNISLGLGLLFISRMTGAQYFINSIDDPNVRNLSRRQTLVNFVIALPFLLYFLFYLVTRDGYHIDDGGVVSLVKYKYLSNLLELNISGIGFLLIGLLLVMYSVFLTGFKNSNKGIWISGFGIVLIAFSLFATAGFNNTPFYPSSYDLQSSISIYNGSSSHFTLSVMAVVSLFVPFVLGYISYVWKAMSQKPLTSQEIKDDSHLY